MNLSHTQFNPVALPAINRTNVISTVNITGKSHLDQKVSENKTVLVIEREKSINKMVCSCKMKCE